MSSTLQYRGFPFQIMEGQAIRVETDGPVSRVWLRAADGIERLLLAHASLPLRPGNHLRALVLDDRGRLLVARVRIAELRQTYDDPPQLRLSANPLERLVLGLLVPLSIGLILVGCFAFGFGHGLWGLACFATVVAAFYYSIVHPSKRYARWREQALPVGS
jgi:hypothetical protein